MTFWIPQKDAGISGVLRQHAGLLSNAYRAFVTFLPEAGPECPSRASGSLSPHLSSVQPLPPIVCSGAHAHLACLQGVTIFAPPHRHCGVEPRGLSRSHRPLGRGCSGRELLTQALGSRCLQTVSTREVPAPGCPHFGGSQPSCDGTRASFPDRPSGRRAWFVRAPWGGSVQEPLFALTLARFLDWLASSFQNLAGCFQTLFFQRQKFLGL